MWLGRVFSGVLILAVVSGLVFICSYLVFGLDMCCGVDKVISLLASNIEPDDGLYIGRNM
jgi:hypothetical protein